MSVPTLSDFLARYPDFANVKAADVKDALERGHKLTSETWGPWRQMGALLYAAHRLSSKGRGDGPVARTFRSSPIYEKEAPYSLTPYGRQFETLLNRFSNPTPQSE